MKKSKKLIWEKAYDYENCFDLRVQNPDDVDKDFLMELLKVVDKAPAGQNFNKRAFRLFRTWVINPSEILPKFAFEKLDSWSFSEGNTAKGTDKQAAAQRLWDALFCARPDGNRRITESKNGKIRSEEFNLWWPKQKECQQIE